MISRPPSRSWAPWLFLGLLSLLPNPAMAQEGEGAAPVSPEFVAWQQTRTQETQQPQASVQVDGVAHPLGYQPSPLDLSHIQGPVFLKNGSFAKDGAGELPASYDLRSLAQVTAIRNQDPWGTCWAHGAIASLESTQLKAGHGTFDLSEWHLAWYAYNNFSPALVSFTKDAPAFGYDATFDQGGNNWKAVALLARGTGAVDEADCPYQDSNYPLSSLPKGTEPLSVRLQEALYLPPDVKPIDTTNVKTALMNLGAVNVSIYWTGYYYNSSSHAYRWIDGSVNTNHAVNIVGWDDAYPASNFNSWHRPSTDGAWIVRNSWGPGWGDSGYFYISYDSAIKYGVVYIGGTSSYEQTYQYDPLGWVNSWSGSQANPETAWFSNVFTAKMTEDIGAVSFYAGAANASYELYLRTGVTGSPATGTLALADTGTLEAPGYRTLTLSSPVHVTAGTKFAVIVKLTTPGYNFPIPVEYPISGYSSKATAGAGQSFMGVNGLSWTDATSKKANMNVCLKAFSTPSPITISANTPVTAGKAGLIASVAAQAGCTYAWTIANGKITAGATTRSITYTAGTVGTTALTCTVKSSAGTSVAASADVEVIPAPVTIISADSPVTASQAGLTASVAPQDDMSYAWTLTNGTITSGNDSNAILYTIGKIGTATLKCSVTNLAGTVLTGTKTITVLAAPVTTITAASTATATTAGLKASVPAQTGCTYAWTLAGNGTITSALKNTITYTTGSVGTLTLSCLVTNAAHTAITGDKTVNVVAAPQALIEAETLVVTGRDGLVATVPSQAGTFAWSLTGGTIKSGQGTRQITYKAGAVGTATLKCSVKNLAGTAATDTQAVTVAATVATIKAASPITTGVAGWTAQVPVTAGATYQWSCPSISNILGNGTPSITYTAGSVGTATLQCLVTVGATAAAGKKALAIVAAPVAVIAAADNVTARKTGLKASVPAQTGCTFKWTLTGGTITAGATTRTVTYTVGTAGVAQLGCVVKNAAGTVATDSKPINVLPAPVAAITAESPVLVSTPDLTASVPDQAGSFLWTVTKGTITAGQSTHSIAYTAGTSSPVTLKCAVTNAAGTTATATKTVSVIAKPLATITVASATVTTGGSGLTASVPTQTGCTYAWQLLAGTSMGGVITSSAASNPVTYTAGTLGSATLSCTVTSAGGSSATGRKAITVVAAPSAAITATTPVSAGKPGLTASVLAQAGCTYAWQITAGTSKITAGARTRVATYTAGGVGTTTVTCTVRNAAGTLTTGTRDIAVIAVPVATITTASPVAAGRSGLKASVPLQDGMTYAWTLTGGLITAGADARETTYTVGPVGTATLKCVVTNAAGTSVTGSKALTVTAYAGGAVTTLAGLVGSYSVQDGLGAAARFSRPESAAMDATGNMYVIEISSGCIRKITPAGEVTSLDRTTLLFAHTSTPMQFNRLSGIAMDGSNNLFVLWAPGASMGDPAVQLHKITPAGEKTTLVSVGLGILTSGMTVDVLGNLYVTDTEHRQILKVTPAGVVSVLAGSGEPGGADGASDVAQFDDPAGITVDAEGNLYVTERGACTIRKISPTGNVTTVAGMFRSPGYANGIGSAARFNYPFGITIDAAGSLYVADINNSTIRKITPGRLVLTVAGMTGIRGSADGTGSAARFSAPHGVVANAAGQVFVADTLNPTIRVITP